MKFGTMEPCLPEDAGNPLAMATRSLTGEGHDRKSGADVVSKVHASLLVCLQTSGEGSWHQPTNHQRPTTNHQAATTYHLPLNT
jgi:hypothetical protein